MHVWQYILLFLAVYIGGALAVWLGQSRSGWVNTILAFSGAYLFGLAINHLAPEIIQSNIKGISVWILVGFMLQLLLEQLSKGIEHGHRHKLSDTHLRQLVPMMIGLGLHSLMEGLPLGGYQAFHSLIGSHGHDAASVPNDLFVGIVIHKIPAAFALTALMIASGFRRQTIIVCMTIFAASAPLAALLADFTLTPGPLIVYLMAIVVGSLIHIGTTILYESDSAHRHSVSWSKLIAILIGFSLSLWNLH